LTCHNMSCGKRVQPVFLKVFFSPFQPHLQGGQHTFRPYCRFHPFPSLADFPSLLSLAIFSFRHFRWFYFRLYVLHVSTFLRSFAPCPLKHFFATVGALTPAGSRCQAGLPASRTPHFRVI
jgi:hypothetical protein